MLNGTRNSLRLLNLDPVGKSLQANANFKLFPYRHVSIIRILRMYHSTDVNTNRPVRTRYAPSPTGSLHLGGLRTALYNYLFARKFADGKCLLRIEDTDRTRLVPGAVEQLLRDLNWSNLPFDEGPTPLGGDCGPYTQSERLHIYEQYSEKLVSSGHAYRCFCTPERLDEVRRNQAARGAPTVYDRLCSHLSQDEVQARLKEGQSHVIRMRVPENGTTIVTDAVRGDVTFQNRVIDDQVLVKSDGFPTYHLANIVDDHLMGITHVIRGEEWLPSSPKHALLYKMFGWEAPTFAHLPLLLREDGSKLSKRFKDSSLDYYISKGYLPEAIINFVALLGWHPPSTTSETSTSAKKTDLDLKMDDMSSLRAALDADIPLKKSKAKKANPAVAPLSPDQTTNPSSSELMSVEDMIKLFSLDKVQKGGAAVELHKLNFFHNQYYMRLLETDIDRLLSFIRPHVEKALLAYKNGDFAKNTAVKSSDDSESALRLDLLNDVSFSTLTVDPTNLSEDEFVKVLRRALRMTRDHPCLLSEFPFRTFFLYARPDLTSQSALSMKAEVWHCGEISDAKNGKPVESKPLTNDTIKDIIVLLRQVPDDVLCSSSDLVVLLKTFAKSQRIGLRDLYLPLRYALSGTSSGPGVADQIVALGRQEVITRLEFALQLQ